MRQDKRFRFDNSAISGSVIGQVHAKQMDEKSRKQWAVELGRNRSKSLDAPSWLWTNVVQLVASHESAYLEHCRQYAIKAATR
jgi:uncharacterized protein (DUF2252 family)